MNEIAADHSRQSKLFDRSVSLLCWAYNEEESIGEFLEKAIRIMESVVEDYEIVLIDDGSTDRTYDIALKFQKNNPRLKIFKNETNLNVGISSRRAITYASKEYLFWQTIDWSYDISHLREFLDHLKTYDIVQGVRKQRFWKRSDDVKKGIVSRINYYLIRMLFNVPLSDYQNVTIYLTRWIQSINFEACSSFTNPEGLIKSFWSGKSIKEVHIPFIPRQKGRAKGVNVKTLTRSVSDIFKLWFRWIIRGKRGSVKRGSVARLKIS